MKSWKLQLPSHNNTQHKQENTADGDGGHKLIRRHEDSRVPKESVVSGHDMELFTVRGNDFFTLAMVQINGT